MATLQAPPPEPVFIKPAEAARIIRVSEQMMYDIISGKRGNGSPKVLKFGRAYRIPRDEFMAWANAQVLQPKKPRKGKR